MLFPLPAVQFWNASGKYPCYKSGHSHFFHLSDAELLHLLGGIYFRRAENSTYIAIATILCAFAPVRIRSPIFGVFFHRHPATLTKFAHIISFSSNTCGSAAAALFLGSLKPFVRRSLSKFVQHQPTNTHGPFNFEPLAHCGLCHCQKG